MFLQMHGLGVIINGLSRVFFAVGLDSGSDWSIELAGASVVAPVRTLQGHNYRNHNHTVLST